MVRRSTLLFLAIGLSLVGGSVVGYTYADPYEDRGQYPHYVVHESADAFDDHANRSNVDRNETTHVEEYSPLAREFLTRAIEEGTDSGGTQRDVHRWEPNVCTDAVVYCYNGYEEPASELAYHDRENGTHLVEYGSDRYLVMTYDVTDTVHDPLPVRQLFRFITLLVPGMALSLFAATNPTSSRRQAATVAGFGAGLLLLAVATPYLLMLEVGDRWLYPAGLLGTVIFVGYLGYLSIARLLPVNRSSGGTDYKAVTLVFVGGCLLLSPVFVLWGWTGVGRLHQLAVLFLLGYVSTIAGLAAIGRPHQ